MIFYGPDTVLVVFKWSWADPERSGDVSGVSRARIIDFQWFWVASQGLRGDPRAPNRQQLAGPGPAGRGRGGFPSPLWSEIRGLEAGSAPSTRPEARGLGGLLRRRGPQRWHGLVITHRWHGLVIKDIITSYIFLWFHRFYLSPGVRTSGTPGQVSKKSKRNF